jgi:hypothetical protein
MADLIKSSEIKIFYVWINPNDFIANHNSEAIRAFLSVPQSSTNDNLMFIPNPNFKGGFVSPFQANLLGNYMAEYNLELHRNWYFNSYPSRLNAIFLFESQDDANNYRKRNFDHVGNRELKTAKSVGNYVCSRHDSSWIDFLRLPGWKDRETIFKACNAYWEGKRVIDCSLEHFGERWAEDPIMEILFYGTISFD